MIPSVANFRSEHDRGSAGGHPFRSGVAVLGKGRPPTATHAGQSFRVADRRLIPKRARPSRLIADEVLQRAWRLAMKPSPDSPTCSRVVRRSTQPAADIASPSTRRSGMGTVGTDQGVL